MPLDTSVQVSKKQVDAYAAYFQKSYDNRFSLATVIAMHQCLPGLRGFWPMSVIDYTSPVCTDLSGNGYDLTGVNTPLHGYDGLAPYCEFNGTTQYYNRADGGAGNWADVRGNEAYVASAYRGLMLYAWIKPDDALPTVSEIIIGKLDGAGASYTIRRINTGIIRFTVDGGAGVINCDSTTVVGNTKWTHIAGRFESTTPSMSVWVDGVKENTQLVGVPATILDVTAPFTIGARAVPNLYYDGKVSMAALVAMQHDDRFPPAVYQQSRALYGE